MEDKGGLSRRRKSIIVIDKKGKAREVLKHTGHTKKGLSGGDVIKKEEIKGDKSINSVQTDSGMGQTGKKCKCEMCSLEGCGRCDKCKKNDCENCDFGDDLSNVSTSGSKSKEKIIILGNKEGSSSKTSIGNKEEDLNNKEEDLNNKEEDLNNKEDSLNKTSNSVNSVIGDKEDLNNTSSLKSSLISDKEESVVAKNQAIVNNSMENASIRSNNTIQSNTTISEVNDSLKGASLKDGSIKEGSIGSNVSSKVNNSVNDESSISQKNQQAVVEPPTNNEDQKLATTIENQSKDKKNDARADDPNTNLKTVAGVATAGAIVGAGPGIVLGKSAQEEKKMHQEEAGSKKVTIDEDQNKEYAVSKDENKSLPLNEEEIYDGKTGHVRSGSLDQINTNFVPPCIPSEKLPHDSEILKERDNNNVACEGHMWKRRRIFACFWHEKYFVLTKDGMLKYHKANGTKYSKGHWDIKSVNRIHEVFIGTENHPYRLALICDTENLLFGYDDPDTREFWYNQFSKFIDF